MTDRLPTDLNSMVFNPVFQSYHTMAFSEILLLILHTIYIPSKLLPHITILETTDSGERRMKHIEMTIINPWKEYWNIGSTCSHAMYDTDWNYRC